MEYLENYYGLFLNEGPTHYIKEDQIGEYVNLLNDYGFKHVFGRDVNKDILIAFLNGIRFFQLSGSKNCIPTLF